MQSLPLPLTPSLALLLLALPHATHAMENGMDMSMDDGMSLAAGNMLPFLHFSPISDTLLFNGWVPQSGGAVFGACVGFFVLALVERWLGAVRAMMEAGWGREARRRAKSENDAKGKRRKFLGLSAPPFVPANDIMRGVIHAVQAALGFVFMLVVMTFQASYIITLVIGLGVGEMLFGRYAAAAAASRGH
ncbi:copper transporter [Favolaschia claudopus]|uniref:Copper transport protein n=1 Tax=Favolaschia claudopus TaxID=2862362 RepID=A0AAW0CFG6_9AGAR